MTRILIIEDDLDIRTDLAEVLRDEGYEVTTAADGFEALRLLRAGLSPGVILLDLMMPIMDGWQFRIEQLQDPALAGFPVLLLSGAGDVRGHTADLRVSGYVEKPIRLDALLEAVSCFVKPSER
jgi:CheY-like chemotaxis protein